MKLPGVAADMAKIFNHKTTMSSVKNSEVANRYKQLAQKAGTAEDQRSMKSEYDYSNKKVFVDVLGAATKSRLNGGSGLHNFYLGQ